MGKWIKPLVHLGEYRKVGLCPYCKSANTHFGYETLKNSEYGFGAVWCSDCNHGMLLCRVRIADIVDWGEPIPNNLILKY